MWGGSGGSGSRAPCHGATAARHRPTAWATTLAVCCGNQEHASAVRTRSVHLLREPGACTCCGHQA
eukprot:234540-Chlamydomonas_euryale.AAC.1